MNQRRVRRFPPAGITVVMISLLAIGCQASYFLTLNEEREVKAEFNQIGDRKVAVIVWADRPTQDLYPRAPRRVADKVVYQMKRNLPDAEFVPPRDVEKFQRDSGLDWESMSNTDIASELKCDLVLRIDLFEYTTRAAETRELRRSRIGASVSLYEMGLGGREQAVYTTEISATYPSEGEPIAADIDDEEDLLELAGEQFAHLVATKFYDHTESLRGRNAD